MPVIAIPDPSLVVLVGAAGAGKSTFAARYFRAEEVLSSDAFRAIVGRGESDQAATRTAFAALHRALTRRLEGGRLTVVDATNVERHARIALVRRARTARVPAVAIVLDLPPRLVVARNSTRPQRIVDPAVVRRHLVMLRRAIDRGLLEREGFDVIYRIREAAEADAIEILHRPRRRPPSRSSAG